MQDLASRLKGLKHLGFYAAPDDAKITPVQIPENIELVELITGGEVFFEVNGNEKTFGKGTIFWHQTGEHTIYRTTSERPYRCIVFGFSVSDLDRPVPRVSFWNSDANTDLERFASECLHLFHSQRLDMDVLSLYTYSTLLRHAMAANANSSNRWNCPEPLGLALAYIHNNIEKKIPVAVLSRNSRISQAQLFKLFRTHLNVTPHNYILSQQLLQARTILAGTSLPIKVIASKCGFENLEVFYRRFRGESGIPPGEYRRKHLPYHLPKNNQITG